VSNLIEKSREEASSSGSKPKLPLVRIKVNQELFMAVLSHNVVNIKEIELFFRCITPDFQR
jgi:hypothetical protein